VSPAASSVGVGIGSARGGGGTAPGGRSVAVAVAPSRSPRVGKGPRALRIGAGAGAAGLAPPSTPKLDGARVSRAGSRVSVALLAVPVGEAGGSTTVAGKGAVPVPLLAGAAGETAGAAAPGGMPAIAPGFGALPRMGGGGGPTDLSAPGFPVVVAGVAADWATGAEPAGRGAGRSGGLGGSVTGETPRSTASMPPQASLHVSNTTRKSARATSPARPAPAPRWPPPGCRRRPALAHTHAPWSLS